MNALNGASPNASGWKPEMGDGGPAGTVVTAIAAGCSMRR
jgi:hypothetical protein